ncbi:MAG: AtpZ/AtpI family protein [Rhodospirillales bacterium]|nr:AtpZ/AtpI family protein [Rhodospirillales bacterium]
MVERKPPEALEDFDARLRKARESAAVPGDKTGKDDESQSGMLGAAFRIGIEMVSAFAVGFGIGWLLDQWLGTRPWLMLVFLLLGGAAGMLNVYRFARGFGYDVGYKRKDESEDDQGT